MDFTPECELRIELHEDGGVKYAECACGAFLRYSISSFVSNRHSEEQRFERLWHEHKWRKIGPRRDDEV
jgi:hypothetical protein